MAIVQFGNVSADMRLSDDWYNIALLQGFDAYVSSFVPVSVQVISESPSVIAVREFDTVGNFVDVTFHGTFTSPSGPWSLSSIDIEAVGVEVTMSGSFTLTSDASFFGNVTAYSGWLVSDGSLLGSMSGVNIFVSDALPDVPPDNVLLAGADTITAGGGNDYLLGYDGNDLISGGAGNDTLNGGAGNDTMNGGDGDDIFISGAGDDEFFGGSGLDTADYSADPARIRVNQADGFQQGGIPADTAFDGFGDVDRIFSIRNIIGTQYEDEIWGGSNANVLEGGGGNDFIFGQDGNDTLNGGDGNDTLQGGTGADTMVGGLGDDTYVVDDIGDVVSENAAEGTDTVQTALASYTLGANVENLTFTTSAAHTGTGNALANVLTGGAGNDTFFAGAGADTIIGGDGNDLLVGHADLFDSFNSVADVLDGGAGDDILYGEASDAFQGGSGRDLLYIVNSNPLAINLGASGIEWIQSDFGNDVIDGSTQTVGIEVYSDGGNDSITGSAFADIIWSGSGDDWVAGGAGDDVIVADVGVDTVTGGDGNDSLYGDSGDTFDGGAGFDALYITGGAGVSIDFAVTQLEWAADFVGGDDALDGSGASVALEVYAAGGMDVVTGGSSVDFLWGGAGDDVVSGNAGDDTLVGETGMDILTGGLGVDALYGNSGNGGDGVLDTFVFGDGWGTDFVFDFDNGVDKLDVSAVTGLNSFADLTVTDTPDGHAYVTFGSDLIAVANASGLIDASDFLF